MYADGGTAQQYLLMYDEQGTQEKNRWGVQGHCSYYSLIYPEHAGYRDLGASKLTVALDPLKDTH